MKNEIRVATYISKKLHKWLEGKAKERGSNESAVIREAIIRAMNDDR